MSNLTHRTAHHPDPKLPAFCSPIQVSVQLCAATVSQYVVCFRNTITNCSHYLFPGNVCYIELCGIRKRCLIISIFHDFVTLTIELTASLYIDFPVYTENYPLMSIMQHPVDNTATILCKGATVSLKYQNEGEYYIGRIVSIGKGVCVLFENGIRETFRKETFAKGGAWNFVIPFPFLCDVYDYNNRTTHIKLNEISNLKQWLANVVATLPKKEPNDAINESDEPYLDAPYLNAPDFDALDGSSLSLTTMDLNAPDFDALDGSSLSLTTMGASDSEFAAADFELVSDSEFDGCFEFEDPVGTDPLEPLETKELFQCPQGTFDFDFDRILFSESTIDEVIKNNIASRP